MTTPIAERAAGQSAEQRVIALANPGLSWHRWATAARRACRPPVARGSYVTGNVVAVDGAVGA
jgi:hypothetical protein